ncbi:RnfABCDGE type electron transport complex subunit D [Aestuariicoccus sp. MJ-SS9]|uniref:RnfABCDGE type electron transport complex subunit D n=1 Tax=Aestuariicoccus sp. MJ-SS9 TaxID=3079855 RepID=UPI00291271AB|nr:RnfABCDGE type electron transport complex subunit D [Aestuariicoccus sp. MJ-SS9]MDU8913068.1 RnfABCDGE type electron transport complex subunit D [Aestuariicoccus sp. MJ-SS9]
MIRGLWNRETVAAILLAAYLPIALIWVGHEGKEAFSRLGLSLLVVAIWHLVFMLARAQPPSLYGLATALAVAILAPEEIGVFRMALALSFGVVMGELVFGGWGRNVVNPATVTLSFLGFGFPSFEWPVFDLPVAWAAIPAALIGIATGTMPVSVLMGAGILGAGAVAAGYLSEPVVVASAIVLVLLVADPVTSASTSLGRWLNGVVFAALVVLFANGWAGAAGVQIAVAAAFLSSLSAPLLDEAALSVWVAQRRKRHGRS